MKKFLLIISELLFPTRCINCQKLGSLLCQDCLALIDYLPNNVCPICGSPKILLAGELCRVCKKENSLDGILAAADYNNPIIKKSILLYKYPPFLKDLSKPLAFLIISQLKSQHNNFWHNFVISFIPLSYKRLKFRGFNQSEEIAKIISEEFQLPLISPLKRQRETIPQIELTKQEREENVRGAFKISQEDLRLVVNKKILLVDDVCTTGATLNEAAKILKDAGAKEVWGVVVAREF